jgi:hypothetical protein
VDDLKNGACLRLEVWDVDQFDPDDSCGYLEWSAAELLEVLKHKDGLPKEYDGSYVQLYEDPVSDGKQDSVAPTDKETKPPVAAPIGTKTIDGVAESKQHDRSTSKTGGTVFAGWSHLFEAKNGTKLPGELNYSIEFYPKIKEVLVEPDRHRYGRTAGQLNSGAPFNRLTLFVKASGILDIQVHQANKLEISKEDMAAGTVVVGRHHLNPYFKIFINDKVKFRSRVKVNNTTPYWYVVCKAPAANEVMF